MSNNPFESLPWKIICPNCGGEAMRLSGYQYNCENCGKINMEGRTLTPK